MYTQHEMVLSSLHQKLKTFSGIPCGTNPCLCAYEASFGEGFRDLLRHATRKASDNYAFSSASLSQMFDIVRSIDLGAIDTKPNDRPCTEPEHARTVVTHPGALEAALQLVETECAGICLTCLKDGEEEPDLQLRGGWLCCPKRHFRIHHESGLSREQWLVPHAGQKRKWAE